MKRREFIASSIAAAAGASALASDSLAQTPSKPMPEFYELRQYHLRTTMRQDFSDYLKDVSVPALNRATERWGPKGVQVIGVSLEPDAAHVSQTAKEWDVRYDVYPVVQGQEKTTEALFPNGLPTSLFVRKGEMTVHEKRLDDTDLDRLIPSLLDSAQ